MQLFTIIQLIIALLLVVVIILQTRGNKGGMVGGAGESYRSKRGMEKILFYATIVLAAFFALTSILSLINS